MKKFIAIVLAVCAVLLVFASCGGTKPDDSSDAGFKRGAEVFKDVTCTDLEGNEVDSSIFKGKKLTMVNIWATFCRPCIGEMPDLQKISEDFAEKGVQIVGIVSDVADKDDKELIDLAKSIEAETGVKYKSLVPSESLLKAKLNEVYSVPETIFLDENGKQIGESYIGSRSYESWAAIIEMILADIEK